MTTPDSPPWVVGSVQWAYPTPKTNCCGWNVITWGV